jgi:hypothetical protein
MGADEYETLQDLHQWKINHLRADQVQLTYSSELELKFNCQAFIPDLGSASISLLSTGKGPTRGLFELVQSNLGLILKGKKVSLATVCRLSSPSPLVSSLSSLSSSPSPISSRLGCESRRRKS